MKYDIDEHANDNDLPVPVGDSNNIVHAILSLSPSLLSVFFDVVVVVDANVDDDAIISSWCFNDDRIASINSTCCLYGLNGNFTVLPDGYSFLLLVVSSVVSVVGLFGIDMMMMRCSPPT